MTQHSSDTVERVALAIRRAVEKATPLTWTEDAARAALEASHHAELVEALTDVREWLSASAQCDPDDIISACLTRLDDTLAKIGGDA